MRLTGEYAIRFGGAIASSNSENQQFAKRTRPMNISIPVRDIECTPQLRKDVERSIRFGVDRYKPQVNEVSVYLADLNGPKGGVDKLCQITANFRGRSNPVLILERAREILPAINRAAHRLGNRIAGRIRRRNRPSARRFRATIRAGAY
jgi:putative sigma-54 modulation protein